MKTKSKYQPLLDYLLRAETSEVTLSFDEIDSILNAPLPGSARCQRSWWSNRSKGALQANSWMNAGFLVEEINFEKGHIIFRKPPSSYQVEWENDRVKWNGDLIKALRRYMGLSQTEFAEKLGVRQQTVSDWETKLYDPRRSTSKYLTLVAEQAGFIYDGETETH